MSDCNSNELYLPFFGKESFLSNHHPSPIVIGNEHFFCVEQFYMVRKARFFKDQDMEKLFLESNEAGYIKRMSHRIKNLDEDLWDQQRVSVMCEGLRAKFMQNQYLEDQLIATGNQLLVEASAVDDFWGAGLSKSALKRIPSLQWPGANMLGSLLMALRSRLRANRWSLQKLHRRQGRKARKAPSLKRLKRLRH